MKQPNVVFIISDDQGFWSLGCAGNREIYTPNIDRLAAQGMRFENFFCVSPVCSPARASLLTGCIPSQHGVHVEILFIGLMFTIIGISCYNTWALMK